VCFRYRPAGAASEGLDELNARLRARSLADGRFYLLKTKLGERGLWLRTALMNPLTEDRDLDELIAHLRALA